MADRKQQIGIAEGLRALLRCKVRVETRLGHVRTGTLTGIRSRQIEFGEAEAEFPEAIVLDRDEGDPIPVADLSRIARVKPPKAE